MPVKRRIQILLVLLCLVAAAYKVYRWQINMAVWGNAWSGNLPALKQKLDQGGNPDSSWQGTTALCGATFARQRQAAVLLLQRGADPNNAIGAAVERGDPALVALMFAHGLDVHSAETRDAFSYAIVAGRADMVEVLLKHEVDPNARNTDGGTTSWQDAHNPEALKQHDSARILAVLRAAGAK